MNKLSFSIFRESKLMAVMAMLDEPNDSTIPALYNMSFNNFIDYISCNFSSVPLINGVPTGNDC